MHSRSELDERRRAIVLEHLAGENARDIERTMRTFHRARYEIVPIGAVIDGDEAVRAMLVGQWEGLPPVTVDAETLCFGEHGVMVETRTVGTRADGAPIDMLTVNYFGFEDDRLVLERCFFDRLTMAEQLGLSDTGDPAA